MKKLIKGKKKLTSFQLIILGFAGVVLLGALLLMLPISSKDGSVTPFTETLFTATSAGCVTGLIVEDTGSHWSVFGQVILIILIQVGGLGVITTAAALSMLSGKKIGLMQRSTMQESISAHSVGGIVRLTRFILKGTAIIELTGAVSLMPAFCRDYGLKGVWYSLFHSISAFCNAGFDILGTENSKFGSLTKYSGDVLINTVIMLLITVGGIGFLVWEDIGEKKLRIKQYRMQSKVVLVTSAFLIFLPALYFFFADFGEMGLKDRILNSLFQSVTLRTAGFNTADFNAMSEGSRALMIPLMLIGGSPGSTAGGMKTTTLAVLILTSFSVFRRKNDTAVFGRRIDVSVVRNAAAILIMYITLFFVSALAISGIEGLPLADCLFETASAIGTVGVTLGITPSLGVISRLILTLLMFMGRVGGLTLIFALSRSNTNTAKYPLEKITVG